MSNKNGRESREDALERILAETAKNPYTPKRQARPQRPVAPAKPIVKTIPSDSNKEESVKAPETPVRKAEPRPVVKPKPQTDGARTVSADAENGEQPVTSAAAKIAAIKRAREQSEQNASEAVEKAAPKARETQNTDVSAPVKKQPEPEIQEAEENEYFEDIDDDEYYDYEEESSGESLADYLLGLVESAITVVLVVLLFYTYIIHIAEVDGPSMEPTLFDGDKLLVRSIMYTPECEDVVIINNENANLISESGSVVETEGLDKMIVKRVIATGGQTVDIDFETGMVTVDGNALSEEYISELTTRDEYAFEYPLTIPEGYVFVMGDNRNISMDSRHPKIGLVSEDDIVGEAFMRVYPFGEFGLIE